MNSVIMINDKLPDLIRKGSVVTKGYITEFGEDWILFNDGSKMPADTVVFATGYGIKYDFLDNDIIQGRSRMCLTTSCVLRFTM